MKQLAAKLSYMLGLFYTGKDMMKAAYYFYLSMSHNNCHSLDLWDPEPPMTRPESTHLLSINIKYNSKDSGSRKTSSNDTPQGLRTWLIQQGTKKYPIEKLKKDYRLVTVLGKGHTLTANKMIWVSFACSRYASMMYPTPVAFMRAAPAAIIPSKKAIPIQGIVSCSPQPNLRSP